MRRLLLLSCALLLGACTSLQTGGPTPPAPETWQTHRARVMAIESWQVQGRLNIRRDDASNTVNLLWNQQGETFTISLSGSFGLGAVRITGNGRYITVEKAGEEPLYAPSLAAITADYLGYEFPAGHLFYWLRGIDAPGDRSELTLNDDLLLSSLAQEDWRLVYDRYQRVGGIDLPGRIIVERAPYRLTFLINSWELPPRRE